MSDLADSLMWKYGPVADTADDEITAWRHPTEPWPTDADIDALMAEYEPVRQARENAQMRAQQRRERIRSDIGDRSELIDAALAAGLGALFRGEPFSSIPQRYRRVLQRLEAIALDPALQPGDEGDTNAR